MPAAISDEILDQLNHALNPLANSAAEYVIHSYPYTTDADKATLAAIKEAAAADLALAQALSAFISDADGIPRNGIPDMIFAEWNYLSFPTLLELLIRKSESDQVVLKSVQTAVQADARAKEIIGKVVSARESASKKFNELLTKYTAE